MNDTTISIEIDGIRMTDVEMENIESVEYIDNDNNHIDDMQMIVHDPDFFYDKRTMKLALTSNNWKGTNKNAKIECGIFNIDSIKQDDITGLHIIKAAATPFLSSVREEKKCRAWERVNLKELARQIARENDLELIYAAELNPVFVRKEQLRASDLLFLSETCRETGIFLKLTANALVIFNPYEQEKKGTIRTFTKNDSEIIDSELRKNSTAYGKCRVSYIDPVTKELIDYLYIKEESGKTLNITRKVSSTEEARLVALYAIKEQNSKEHTGLIECEGDISLAAGAAIELKGYGEFDMQYMITRASHIIRGNIYRTKLCFEKILEGY